MSRDYETNIVWWSDLTLSPGGDGSVQGWITLVGLWTWASACRQAAPPVMVSLSSLCPLFSRSLLRPPLSSPQIMSCRWDYFFWEIICLMKSCIKYTPFTLYEYVLAGKMNILCLVSHTLTHWQMYNNQMLGQRAVMNRLEWLQPIWKIICCFE